MGRDRGWSGRSFEEDEYVNGKMGGRNGEGMKIKGRALVCSISLSTSHAL